MATRAVPADLELQTGLAVVQVRRVDLVPPVGLEVPADLEAPVDPEVPVDPGIPVDPGVPAAINRRMLNLLRDCLQWRQSLLLLDQQLL